MSTHNYTISTDTLNGVADPYALEKEIQASSIVTALNNITISDDTLTIVFKAALSAFDTTTLTSVVNAHTGDPIVEIDSIHIDNQADSDGGLITRHKVSKTGRHYQAHSCEFETSSLGSMYNKDKDGNDLGYCNVKFYNSSGMELTDQPTIDTDCVKTVMEWKPTYDFEIISGQIRQIDRVNSDAYMYVEAIVPLPYPPPNDKLSLPFVYGGINLQYIGADEILKTDGRASKELQGTLGQHFVCTVNHAAGVKHKLSVIYEIYKDPT